MSNKVYPITLDEDYGGAVFDYQHLLVNPNLKLLKKGSCDWFDIKEPVCYDYALGKEFDDIFEPFWILRKKYKRILLSLARRGDIITYHSEKNKSNVNNVQHFAVIHKTAKHIKDVIIRSKWARCGVYECKTNEVPEYYGNHIIIWRKK